MKNLLVIALILLPVFAFCTSAGESGNSMNLTITSLPHIATEMKIDAYTIEPDEKCWIMTYYGDTLIERHTPYETKDSATPINGFQFLLGNDPDKQITQTNGAMHYKVLLDPIKYAAGETYQILVECGASSCNMQNFTTTPMRIYPIDIMGINTIHSFALDPRYMLNLILVSAFLGIILFGWFKKRKPEKSNGMQPKK